jgi:transcriptional regulator NrdR family protein
MNEAQLICVDQDKSESDRGVACRKCGSNHHLVLYTRRVTGGRIRRRRECRNCKRRFTTHETTES